MATTPTKDWKGIAEIYRKTYDEVLAALKHQDDKLNRTLTAIAFLTAAGIALFANVAVKISPPVRFSESPRGVTSFFFLVFLGAVVLALISALSAIGPNRRVPGVGTRSETVPDAWPSLLYYLRIIRDREWDSRINEKDADWLYECLARNFHAEAKGIARRVDYKVGGSRQSAAWVHVALLALALLGIFSIEQIALSHRWWIATGLFGAALALPLLDRLLMGLFSFPAESALGLQRLSYWLVASAAGAGVLLLATAPRWESHWWALFYCLGAIVAIRLSYVHEWLARVLLPTAAAAGIACAVLAWQT